MDIKTYGEPIVYIDGIEVLRRDGGYLSEELTSEQFDKVKETFASLDKSSDFMAKMIEKAIADTRAEEIVNLNVYSRMDSC